MFYKTMYNLFSDFDGRGIPAPRFIEQQMLEVLMRDPVLRAEAEVRRAQLEVARDKDNEWVECVDTTTRGLFYYSFQRYKLSYSRPNSKNIVSCSRSLAFQAVLRIQSAYRMKEAKKLVQEKRQKQKRLPKFQTRNFF
jgi:hypothetical protein